MPAPVDRTSNKPIGSDSVAAGDTGHIIIRLDQRKTHDSSDLLEVATEEGFQSLQSFLSANPQIVAQRIIRHVTPDVLRERELIAQGTTFGPIETLTAYWRLDVRGRGDVQDHRAMLHAMPEIAVAYHEMAVINACPDQGPRGSSSDAVGGYSNIYERDQKFLDARPVGIGAHGAWKQPNGDGSGVNVIDVEEGWILAHEDLPAPKLLYGDIHQTDDHVFIDHGTAALGIIAGVNNDLGIIGVAPKVASLNTISHYDVSSATNLHVADAIDAATKHLNPGDVLLLEVQRYDGMNAYPTEVHSEDLHAIRHAISQGITVIEAAGNSGANLDVWSDAAQQHNLCRTSDTFVDSGSIVVGSAAALVTEDVDGTAGHSRYCTSNFGSRVDTYAWGEKIYSTGYGHLAGASGSINSYTRDFGQTSGASAIIAGAAAVIQSWHKGVCGEPLKPQELRSILSNPVTGTPQVNAQGDPIGVMPDLESIMANGIEFRRKVRNVLKRVRLASGATRDPFEKFKVGTAAQTSNSK